MGSRSAFLNQQGQHLSDRIEYDGDVPCKRASLRGGVEPDSCSHAAHATNLKPYAKSLVHFPLFPPGRKAAVAGDSWRHGSLVVAMKSYSQATRLGDSVLPL